MVSKDIEELVRLPLEKFEKNLKQINEAIEEQIENFISDVSVEYLKIDNPNFTLTEQMDQNWSKKLNLGVEYNNWANDVLLKINRNQYAESIFLRGFEIKK